MAEGYRHVRVQLAVPGFSGYGVSAPTSDAMQKARPRGVAASPVFEPTPYVNNTIKMFDYLRSKIGFDVDLIHDVHERRAADAGLRAGQGVRAVPPVLPGRPDGARRTCSGSRRSAQQTSTPLAMGELFVNRNEWLPLVANRWIDFIRIHISAIGGLNMARKVASCCEMFNVRTAWHGPGNVSPVGHAVNMHLDLAVTNFGIQEENRVLADGAGGVPGRAGDQGRLHVFERQARPRHRYRREGGGEVSVQDAGRKPRQRSAAGRIDCPSLAAIRDAHNP